MRKPVVDYSSLRFSNITSPQYSHLLLLLGWIVYFILYFLTETFIPVEHCYIMHSSLDDMIPFCEIFVIPYVFWYLLIVGSLGYFLLYNVDSFKKLQIFIIITQAVAMAIYIAFPNMQDLRPDFFPRDNIFSRAVDVIYSVDTNTNVCPSLHVAYSLGIASVWLKEKEASRKLKVFIVFSVTLICLSTVFIKQHSVIDMFAALIVSLLAEGIVYGQYWKSKIQKPTKNPSV